MNNSLKQITFNKKSTFFLGAGSSIDAGLPSAKDLYTRIYHLLGNHAHDTSIKDHWQHIFEKIHSHCGKDIEETISLIKQIGDYPEDIAILLEFLDATANNSVKELTRDFQALFGFINETCLQEIFEITDNSRVAYIKKFVSLAGHFAMNVFTLNYDNVVELAAKDSSVSLFDGTSISESCDFPLFTNNFSTTERCINLYKLHGSISWKIDLLSPAPRMISANNLGNQFTHPAMVFGKRDKLRSDGFFLDLLFEFNRKLLQSDKLCIIGYSFSDEHINKFMTQWWSSDISQQVIIVDPAINSVKKIPDIISWSWGHGGAKITKGNRDYIDIFPKRESKQVIPVKDSANNFFDLL